MGRSYSSILKPKDGIVWMNTLNYISVAINIFGIAICLIILVSLLLKDNRKSKSNLLFLGIVLSNIVILVSDSFSWIYDNTNHAYSEIITNTASFFGYTFMYVIIISFTLYINEYIKNKSVATVRLIWITVGVGIFSVFTVVISQFNHMYYYIDGNNMYSRQDLYWLSQLFVFLIIALNAIIIIMNRKNISTKDVFYLLSYLALPIVFNVLHILFFDLSLSCVATTLSVVLIYCGIQSEQAKKIAEQELELIQNKTAIMLSQIQPHFLYNALESISDLCEINAEKAGEAISDFAIYMRVNLDSINSKIPIPFEDELKHVKTYLSIEKMRFEERLEFDFDVETTDFNIPALTLQAMVENAVRHGVTQKVEGGKIFISVSEGIRDEKNVFVITVTDNGVGFDINKPFNNSRSHTGIDNARNRLSIMSGGTIDIQSCVGKGTTATIILPMKNSIR